MDKIILLYKYGRHLMVFHLVLITILLSNVQAQSDKGDSTTLSYEPIPPNEIPFEISKLAKQLKEIDEFLLPDEGIYSDDAIIRQYTISLNKEKDDIMEQLASMSFRSLENLIREWRNYESKIIGMQFRLKGRIEGVESVKEGLGTDIGRWQSSYDFLEQAGFQEELRQSADPAVKLLHISSNKASIILDSLYAFQRRETRLKAIVDDMIRILEQEQTISHSNYFVLDSRPIWYGKDSTASVGKLLFQVKHEFNENFRVLGIYLRSNLSIVIFQLAFILALIVGFVLLRRAWPTEELDPNSIRETQARKVISRPFLSALLLSFLLSLFFYTNRPLIFGEFMMMLLMISSIALLPVLLSQKLRFPLLLLLLVYIIVLLQNFLPNQSFANRIIIIIQCVFVIYLLLRSSKLKNNFGLNPRSRKLYTLLHKIFLSIIIIAFVANLIGSVKLSDQLLKSIIKTLLMGVVTVTIVIILNSLLILLIKGKHAQSIPIFEQLKNLIDKRIKPLINWAGMIFWLIITLQIFDLLKVMRYWFDELMATSFDVAGAPISIGGIISFSLIGVFTFVIARFVKNLFKDEWVSNSRLSQGTASALSMTIRYTIVAFGIYLALTSAGVNMNEFGFMAGALGVGIGFGLQNIVLNFIAGIILAFEQPIHIGDVIEVDQFMGRVTEIGVRASKIMTWSGSEVIVPNGLLISNKVVNWTLTDQKRRLEIPFKTAIEADPKKVIGILRATAEAHPNTLATPVPMAIFNGYGDSSLDFILYCWVEFSMSLSTKSEIAINAHEALAQAGIPTPVSMHKFQINQDIDKYLT